MLHPLPFIATKAPAEPPCFPSRKQWVEYLELFQESKDTKKAPRPFKLQEFQKDFNFCIDCSSEFAAQMQEQRLCNPSYYRAIK